MTQFGSTQAVADVMAKPDFEEVRYNKTRVAGAYIITHVASGKMYVGSSNNLFRRRWEHNTLLKGRRHHCIELQRLFNESSALEWKLWVTENREAAYMLEQDFIDHLKHTGKLVNRAEDVKFSMAGLHHTESAKQLMRESKLRLGKGRPKPPRTAEHTENLANARRGLKLTEEWKRHISESGKKVVLSEEARARVLAASRKHTEAIQVPVRVFGVVYPSTQHAAIALDLPYDKVFYRVRSKLAIWDGYQLAKTEETGAHNAYT